MIAKVEGWVAIGREREEKWEEMGYDY